VERQDEGGNDEISQGDDEQDREGKINQEQPRIAPSFLLLFEEVH
jgi:hypothetical protein